MEWYSKALGEVLEKFGADPAVGLSLEEAASRLGKNGPNKLKEKPPRTFVQRFAAQMKDAMVIILLVAALLSFTISAVNAVTGHETEWVEPLVIILIVIVNGVLGVMQEGKAEAALEALKKMSMPLVRVRRGGSEVSVPSADLVTGDVIVLEAGDIVPADSRLVESASLKSDESALTGESVPVEKRAAAEIGAGAAIGDRSNMLHSGCSITYGRGTAVVVATGMDTEMGRIAALLEEEGEPQTPIQRRLTQLGKYLGVAALIICGVIFAFGIYFGLPLKEMFMTSVSLAVAAIPEGLPAIVTIVLAMGVRRMVGRNAIIRRLGAVETLGSTSVICSDKTGTLTQNKMTLVRAWLPGGETRLDAPVSDEVRRFVELAALCTDGRVEQDENGVLRHVGDPTETAIVASAHSMGTAKDDLERRYPRVGEIPFDSDRKLMTTVNEIDGKYTVIVKGAPDILFGRCVSGDVEAAAEANAGMARDALRVLAVGRKELDSLPASFEQEEMENGLALVGLVGMIDPPRPEAGEAVSKCAKAGIKTVMITGDHVVTASAVARELGILSEGGLAVTGSEVDAMTDEELEGKIERIRVYARVSPSNKIRIVKTWQKKGMVVAMTGDGVNDAPALKAADIGCAMGITGTDVSKGASDMILTDDNFATIVSAVREGRGIYDNIRKAIRFLLSCNLGEIVTVFLAMLLWRESPLLPIQILWVNLVTDSFPALALGVEEVEPGVMNRAPRSRDEGVFAGGVGTATVVQGAMIGLLTLCAYHIGRVSSLALGETMAFAVLALSQLTHAMNIRSTHSLFKVGFFSNPYMIRAVALSLALMLSVLCVPFLMDVFKIVPMNMSQWSVVAMLSILPLVFCEAGKAFFRLRKPASGGMA